MIHSFRCQETAKLFQGIRSRRLPQDIQRGAMRKLTFLHGAADLNALQVPPGNHLESLTGDRQEQHSIGINDQWRICFVWREGNAHDVEIVDYH